MADVGTVAAGADREGPRMLRNRLAGITPRKWVNGGSGTRRIAIGGSRLGLAA